jgi:hypothetical protein
MGDDLPTLDYGHTGKTSRFAIDCKWPLAIIALGLSLLLLYQESGPNQGRNMAKARTHIPVVAAKLQGKTEFDLIGMHPYTDLGGSLLIEGDVATNQDLLDLQKLVASTSPPVPIAWSVDVASPEEMDEIRETRRSLGRPK